jgi:hypothetical protein
MPLLPRRAVADTLLDCRIHLLGRDQHDGLQADSPRGIDRQRNRARGHTIWHVGDNEKIVTTVRIIKGFKPATLLRDQLLHGLTPFRPAIPEESP